MGKETLLEAEIEAGKILLQGLDRDNLGITTAMWLYNADSNEWKLLFSSPKFREPMDENPINVYYSKVLNVYRDLNEKVDIIPVEALTLIFYDDRFLEMFKHLKRVEGIATVRMRSNYVKGFYIEDAVIYRNI